jgi:gamma-glutamyl hydrolase
LVNGVLFTGGWAKDGLYFETVGRIFKVSVIIIIVNIYYYHYYYYYIILYYPNTLVVIYMHLLEALVYPIERILCVPRVY